MRVLLKISPLFLCIIASQTVFADVPDFAECTHGINAIVDKYEANVYGGLNAFYDINKGIADGLQKTMSDQMVTDIYNYIEGSPGHKSLGTIINDVVKSQAGAIAFFCVGLLFILVSLIVAITICSCRCCCNSCGAKKDDITYPSIWSAVGMIAGLVSIFAFVLTGVIIFNVSSNNLYGAIDKSPDWISEVVTGLNDVVTVGTSDMNCTIGKTVDSTFGSIETQMQAYPNNLINQYLDNTGLNDLYNFNFTELTEAIKQANKQADAAETAVKTVNNGGQCTVDNAISDELTKTKGDLTTTQAAVEGVEGARDEAKKQTDKHTQELNQTVSDPINSAVNQMKIAQYNITTQMNSITGAVNQTMQTVYSLQNAIDKAQHDIVTWSGYKPVRSSWQALMSVPNCLCLLFALITVAFLGLWIFRGNETPRGLGYLPIIGFYCVIFIAWIAMGVASATFVGGWAVSAVCKPMFEDPTFRVYGIADTLKFEITGFNNTQSTITVQQLLTSCSAKQTMFKAIGGDQLISVPMVMNMLDLSTYLSALDLAIGQADLTYTFPDDTTNKLNEQQALIQQDTTFFDDQNGNFLPGCDANDAAVKEANEKLKTFTKTMDNVNMQLKSLKTIVDKASENSNKKAQQQELLKTYTNDQFQQVNDNINSSVTALINQLDTNTFPCYPLYLSFENAGTIICDYFGRPVHGMWGAAGLAAIFFIPAALLLLCASKTLFTGRREKSFKSADERTLYADVAPSSVHRTKTAQDLWAEEEDPFALPKIRSDAPQPLPRVSTNDYYPSQPTAAAAAPWLDDSVSKGSGLRRMDEGLQRSDNYNPYGTESGLRRNDNPESSRRLGGDERWGSDASSGSGSRGLRRADGDVGGNQPEEERWSNSALRRL